MLRGLSYLIGWIGLCIVAFSPGGEQEDDWRATTAMALAPALWPALFPMWFVEMGRLGSDCLVAFWAACAAVLIRRSSLKGDLLDHLLLGIVCALGLLTKATFLPLVAAVFLFLCYRTWRGGYRRPQAARGLAVFIAAVVVISGWWYGKNFYDTGSLIGSNDEFQLSGKGSLLSLVLERLQEVSPRVLIGGFLAIGRSFLWGGTWSFVLPPLLSELPLALLILFIVLGYLRAIVRAPPRDSEWIYPVTLVLFLAGLFHHALIYFALLATISVPAWYLHSLAPVFAPMVGRGVAETLRWRLARPFAGALLLYPTLFLPFGTGILALYYAGCGDKYPNQEYYNFWSANSCISDVASIIHNLSVLSNPWASIGLFIVGWVLMLIGMILSIRMLALRR